MRRFALIFLLAGMLATPLPGVYGQRRSSNGASAAAAAAPVSRAAAQITAAQLRDYLSFIASDEMEGRDTPSRGLDTVAKFIALNLSRWGLKPAGDNGTFFQRISMQRQKIDPANTRAEISGQGFSYGEDFLAPTIAGTVAGAPLVYVGHGWVVKAKNIDAYQGVDVKDKVMVLLGGLPKGVTFADLQGGKEGVDWIDPETYAQTHGAKGIISLPGKQTLAFWERSRQNALTRGTVSIDKFRKPGEATFPRAILSEKMVNALFQGEKQSAAAILARDAATDAIKAFDFSPEKKVNLTVTLKAEPVYTQNVVAVLEGKDPVLKNEYVALGAHYDHVGTGAPGGAGRAPSASGDTTDTIWNGADDDGSGTTALLALAETVARNPAPRRSILFVWHCGEEKGLWGSRYFTDNPTIPLDRIVTQINIDMIGRSKKEGDTNPLNKTLSGPNEVYVIGSRMMSTQLGDLSERVNKGYLNLAFNYTYDDPKDPNRFFYRSDHFNYAKKGIPIIFFFDGEHEDYHRPGDTADKIDYQKMEKITRTVYATMWELANLPARPKVDKPLPAEVTQD